MLRRSALISAATFLAAALPGAAWAAAVEPCSRPVAGSTVLPAGDLFSTNGTLTAALTYQTAMDDAARTLFCFQTTSGVQSPSLHVWPGDTLNLSLRNQVPALPPGSPTEIISSKLDECGSNLMTDTSTNIHFHGTNVAPTCGSDDVVNTLVNSGASFQYHLQFPIDEPPGLYWYHPHVHGIAEAAVLGGASGILVVEGIERLLPQLAGLPERILILRDQTVANNPTPGGAIPSWDASVNYVPVSYPAETPAVIRMAGHGPEFWRVANAAADTIFKLQLVYDGVVQPLALVGLDAVPVNSQDGTRQGRAIAKDQILVPPAGRAEFVIPAIPPGTKRAEFRTLNIQTGPLGDNDPTRVLATLSPDDKAAPTLRIMPQPTQKPGPQRFEGLAAAPVTAQRKLYFSEVLSDPSNPASPTNFYITVDGATPTLFDPVNPPAIVTHQGAVEDWVIENRSGENHEFHIHQIHFKMLERNGVPLPPDGQQFRDTVQLPYWSGTGPYPSIKVRMDFRGPTVGDFVYHCHILGHEDNGMMAIIRVLPAS